MRISQLLSNQLAYFFALSDKIQDFFAKYSVIGQKQPIFCDGIFWITMI